MNAAGARKKSGGRRCHTGDRDPFTGADMEIGCRHIGGRSIRRLPGPAGCETVAGFTLVELLVVIGIIAVMLSILLPVLGKSRARARELHCAANLRQLGACLVIYANQNRGWLPAEPTEHNPHLGLLQAMTDLGLTAAVFYCGEAEREEDFARAPTYTPVGQTDSVLPTPDNIAAGRITYLYWSFLANKCGGSPPKYWRQQQYFIPRTLTLSRAFTVTGQLPFTSAIASADSSQRWVACDFFRQGAPFPHDRQHAGGLNVLYLDGHVQLVTGSPSAAFR